MSRIDRYLCDNPHCTKETTDPISDFWIHFDCHGDDGCTLKKGKGILLTDLQDRDFCSMDCLLEVLDTSKVIKEKTPEKVSQRGYTSKRPISVPKLGTGSRKAYEWIWTCPTLQECLAGFRERYTKWKVSDEDLTAIWKYYHPQQCSPPIEVQGIIKKRYPFSNEELDIIERYDNHHDAWEAYKAAFPNSERDQSSIKIKWNKNWEATEGEKRRRELAEREKESSSNEPVFNSPPDELNTNQDSNSITEIIDPEIPKNNGFFVGAKVVQVKGAQRAFGVGDVTQIRPNGDLVVEFFHNRKVLPADHFASYQTKKQDEDQALAVAVEES